MSEPLPQTATVISATKAWNVVGLKCAAVVAGSVPCVRLATLPVEVQMWTGRLGVLAVAAAFCEGQPWLTDLLAHLDCNRRLLADLLAAHLLGWATSRRRRAT